VDASVDGKGWQIVTRKKKKKKLPHPLLVKCRGKVPMDLIGLCFNCFTTDHVACCCPNPSYCFRCREPRHAA
jgi:hypothetical protein